MSPTDGNLVRLLVRRVSEAPQRPLYIFLDRTGSVAHSLSRESLFYSACRLAAVLQERGLRGCPVALYLPPDATFVTAFWAAVLAGTIPVPLAGVHSSNRRGTGAEGAAGRCSGIPLSVLSRSGARAVLTVASRAAAVSAETARPVIVTDDASVCGGRWKQPDPGAEQVVFLQYTSGSTASPRGVRITHGNILHNSESIRQAFGVRADDCGVCWLPLHHDMGLIGHVIQPLYSGISNHFLLPTVFAARPLRWLQAMARHGGTISGGPDSAYALCNRLIAPEDIAGLDLSRWRLAYCGAEPVRARTLERFARRLRGAGFDRHALYPCYGLAESTLFVSGRHGLRTAPVPGSGNTTPAVSTGAGSPDSRVRIVDPVSGERRPDGQVGEITLHSASVAAGYHDDPVSSDRRFPEGDRDAVPVLRTGDLGFRQEGELYITGRMDNCFQYHGRNVFAEDIEAAVMTSESRGIARCAAFAVESGANEDSGPRIVIVMEQDGRVRSEEVERYAAQVPGVVSRATGVLPHAVCVWPRGAIPVTTSGKVRRNHCRQRYRDAMTGHREARNQR